MTNQLCKADSPPEPIRSSLHEALVRAVQRITGTDDGGEMLGIIEEELSQTQGTTVGYCLACSHPVCIHAAKGITTTQGPQRGAESAPSAGTTPRVSVNNLHSECPLCHPERNAGGWRKG